MSNSQSEGSESKGDEPPDSFTSRINPSRYADIDASKQDVKFRTSTEGNLELGVGETRHQVDNVRSANPVSDPWNMIVIYGLKGEIGYVNNAHNLDDESKKELKGYLDRGHFMPEIKTIFSVRKQFQDEVWDVMTNKGRVKELTILTPETTIRHLYTPTGQDGQLTFRDGYGTPYKITLADLDKGSIRRILHHL